MNANRLKYLDLTDSQRAFLRDFTAAERGNPDNDVTATVAFLYSAVQNCANFFEFDQQERITDVWIMLCEMSGITIEKKKKS